jgi:hypothetical protein
MTPEGLNSRLTFLLQCTRQGPTSEDIGANNLAFGRPPICILRIGDFYHTKIVIDSINISYEPLIWDLNPEGIGVQPMLANVDMSFSFIGGSSLMGPINKLQNALSFNYFANTHVYDPRADYIAKKSGISVGTLAEGDSSISTLETNLNNVKAKKEPGYEIVDGVSYAEYESNLKSKLTRELINETEVNNNQVKQEEVTNSGPENLPQQTSTTLGTDDEVITSVRLESYREVSEGDDTLQIGLGFYPPEDKPNLKFAFLGDKIYKGNLSINRLNSSSISNINFFITGRRNDDNSTIFKGESEVTLSSTDKSWVLEIPLTDNDLDFLLAAKNDTTDEHYSLRFRWDTTDIFSSVGYAKANGG